jgi:hypothetical protein
MKNALQHLKETTRDFLKSRFKKGQLFDEVNEEMRRSSGINNFFPAEADFDLFLDLLSSPSDAAETMTRREYGDFQTPNNLSKIVCATLENLAPKILVEPTFGTGSFIVSAIETFSTLKQIHGIEIHEPYCWHTKFSILEHFIERPDLPHPSIYLYNEDVFKFDFRKLAKVSELNEVLVLGNPPWVTNSELGSLNSKNIPIKSNFKSVNGLDAITGKGNFDIGEYIILSMLNTFASGNGALAMLVKNAVIKNVINELPKAAYSISNIISLKFDAKTYFNASVEASLFRCNFGKRQDTSTCKVASLESPQTVESEFGWVDQKFVSDVNLYKEVRSFDGSCPFVWRQGVKHDCSRILELELIDGKYKNGHDDVIDIEDDLVFPLIKSSDIQNGLVLAHRKFVIITQRKVGDDTTYIAKKFPRLSRYLSDNLQFLSERKSIIYNGKSPFAIFGIGDYSFKPYKVAISGLYKKPKFSLVYPANGKPSMLDDTCYFIGFDDQAHAAYALILLNAEPVQKLLRSLAFTDAKRPYTKDILMRIDLFKVGEYLGNESVLKLAVQLPENILKLMTRDKWKEFLSIGERHSKTSPQTSLFDEPSAFSTNPVSHAV